MPAVQKLLETIGAFTSTTRLYSLQTEGEASALLVQAWAMRESLNQPWELEITALATSASLDVHAMLGQRTTLLTTLADGTRQHPRSGLITAATSLGSDGGFASYRLTVQPWLGLLTHVQRSQVWQECAVGDIIDSLFAHYSAHAAWTWSPCAQQHLAQSHQSGLRSYTVQYRESDLAFLQRLCAHEGLVLRFEIDDAAPLGHKLVIVADTTQATSCPPDASCKDGDGVRFHRASSQENTDSIQALGGVRRLQAATSSTLVWDYKTHRALQANVPTAAAFAGKQAPRWTSFDTPPDYSFADTTDAQRAMTMAQQALESRHKCWLGRSTVRTFTAGTQFRLKGSTLDTLQMLAKSDSPERDRFVLLEVTHAGINNLPKDMSLPDQAKATLPAWVPSEVAQQAAASGYGNAFEAIRAHVPWRALLWDGAGTLAHPHPTCPGPLTATVVGPSGQDQAHGAGEIHTDALGRIRIRFDFQMGLATPNAAPGTRNTSTWVRVAQRWAGGGSAMGWQFIPRVGQEVLVGFLGGDIHRPYVMGALYNGQGETDGMAHSTDHRPSAQGNRVGSGQLSSAGGHSPAWHGAGGGDASAGAVAQNNASALNGIKTREFGGAGHNQLVFDDSRSQLRVQLATTQHATQLNLGHLIHQADNHRGSVRGEGFELRTDAYGAIRAAQGVHLSTHATQSSEPAGDNAPGMALMRQLGTLGQSFHKMASTHQTVALAAQAGSSKANASALSAQSSPLAAGLVAVSGMVDGASFDAAQSDAAAQNTATGQGKLPHSAQPMVSLSAKAGWALTAGADLHLSADDHITLASGQHTDWATGGAYRLHTGQSIGVLAGVVQPGDAAAGKGLTLIAAQGKVELQAQSDRLEIAAKEQISIQSESAHIDWAAAKKITLATAGGARVVIAGGNITVECPGTLTVKASSKQFSGPTSVGYAMPQLPRHICKECLLNAAVNGSAFASRK
jgi:type VI secretion system secreted protein VgrG